MTQTLTTDDELNEYVLHAESIHLSSAYFVENFVQIKDKVSEKWISFNLWQAQSDTLRTFETETRVVVLKARQLGVSWLALSFALWCLITRENFTILLFSIGDRESMELMDRFQGMYDRLPAWIKGGLDVSTRNNHELALSNGSSIQSFPSGSGDSYTANLVIADEFDLVQDQGQLLARVEPTIADGICQFFLISRVDKKRPNTPFKRTFRSAQKGENSFKPVFIPWFARPSRSAEWYADTKQDILSQDGSLDRLHEQYPATIDEALAPRSQDKRIPIAWLLKVREEVSPIESEDAPALPSLVIYSAPVPGEKYCIGADPAEGNPNSDESALTVLNYQGEQVAVLAGKFEPGVLADYALRVSDYYNDALLLPERNNHGHAFILAVQNAGKGYLLITGRDGKLGWLSSRTGKVSLYDNLAEMVRDGEVSVRDSESFQQLANLETTLLAPQGEHDDRADAFALAAAGLIRRGQFSVGIEQLNKPQPTRNLFGTDSQPNGDRPRGYEDPHSINVPKPSRRLFGVR